MFLCRKFSLTVPDTDIVRINPSKDTLLGVEVIINSLDHVKHTMYDASYALGYERIAEERWRFDLVECWEMHPDVPDRKGYCYYMEHNMCGCM